MTASAAPSAGDGTTLGPAGSFRVGRIHGAPVLVSPGLVAAAVVAVVLLAQTGDGPAQALPRAVAVVGVVVLSFLVHEVGHAVLAIRRGFDVHAVTLTAFGGGTRWSGRPSPRTEGAIALAGPLTSGVVGLAATAPAWLLDGAVGQVFAVAAAANFIGAIINLVPLPGTDGGHAVAAAARSLRRRDA